MNRTMNLSIRMIVTLVMVTFLIQPAAAAMISYLGPDTTTGADWRTTSVAKTVDFDPNGDNAYGTDGSFIFYGADGSFYTGSAATGDEGAMHGPPVAISDLPSYIASVAIDSTINYQVSSYVNGTLDDASQPIGTTVADYDKTNWAFNTGTGAGVFQNFFTITLAEDAAFVLDVITGTDGAPYYNGVHAVQVTSGTVSANSFSTAISGSDGIADHIFFELSGVQGDTFTVACMNAVAGVPATTGLGFEAVVPEPSMIVLLISGIIGLLAYARRK